MTHSEPTGRETQLLLDAMLGRLATYLRMCGYDTAYALDHGLEADDEILHFGREHGRQLVTRDRDLAAQADDGVLLESRALDDQLQELSDAGFDLELSDSPERCGVCNGPLTAISPDTQTPEYAPDPITEETWQCEECGQYFWKGSHWDDVASRLADIE